jgi:hypothetical protein
VEVEAAAEGGGARRRGPCQSLLGACPPATGCHLQGGMVLRPGGAIHRLADTEGRRGEGRGAGWAVLRQGKGMRLPLVVFRAERKVASWGSKLRARMVPREESRRWFPIRWAPPLCRYAAPRAR